MRLGVQFIKAKIRVFKTKSLTRNSTAGPMANDLIRLICGGASNRFKGSRCQYYDPSTGDCSLLKEGKMGRLFQEKPRCNPERMLQKAIIRNYKKYSDEIKPKDYIESTVFTLSERLKGKRLTRGYNLAVLHGYINQAANNEVQKTLQDVGLLFKRLCGNCVFLSNTRPPVCTQKEYRDGPSGEVIPNPHYGRQRVPSKDFCIEGFKPLSFFSMNRYEDNDDNDNSPKLHENLVYYQTEEALLQSLELERMRKLLEGRASSIKQETTKRAYQRHHDIFVYRLSLYRKNIPEGEINQLIAQKIGTNEESVRKDMKEIITYLQDTMADHG